MNILTGDCLELMPNLGLFDVICCSPPFNLGVKYQTYKDNLKYNDYLAWMEKFIIQSKASLAPNGSFFLNIGKTASNPLLSVDIINIARKYFVLQNDITWVKSISLPEKSYGHFKPVVSERYLNQLTESILHLTHNGDVKIQKLAIGVPYEDKNNMKRWDNKGKEENLRCRGNVWYIPYQTTNPHLKTVHPAGFPIQLPEYCIKLHGVKEGLKVLDPFLGIGTTLVACKKLGVDGTGIDIDAGYCETAKTWLDCLL